MEQGEETRDSGSTAIPPVDHAPHDAELYRLPVEDNRAYDSAYDIYETLIEKWLVREAEAEVQR